MPSLGLAEWLASRVVVSGQGHLDRRRRRAGQDVISVTHADLVTETLAYLNSLAILGLPFVLNRREVRSLLVDAVDH